MTNISDKPVMGFSVVVEFTGIDGKVAVRQGFTGVRGGDVLADGQPNFLYPGETLKLRRSPVDPKKMVGDPVFRIDAVVFDDGSIYGPQAKMESARMIGVTEGIRLLRFRLKTVMDKSGESEVIRHVRGLAQASQQ